MTEEEQKNHIGHLVITHAKLKEDLKRLASEATPYIDFWMRLNKELQDLSTEYNHPVDMSRYPSANEVQALIGALRRSKRQLRRVAAAALKIHGIELK